MFREDRPPPTSREYKPGIVCLLRGTSHNIVYIPRLAIYLPNMAGYFAE